MGILKIAVTALCLMSFNAQDNTIAISKSVLESRPLIHGQSDDSRPLRLLYFWASWCPECKDKLRNALPDLRQNEKSVEIMAVNMDKDGQKAAHFIEKESVSLPVFGDEDKKLRQALSIYAVPSWALAKKNGENWDIVAQGTGSEIKDIKQAILTAQGIK